MRWAQSVTDLCDKHLYDNPYRCAWATALKGKAALHSRKYEQAAAFLHDAEEEFIESHNELTSVLADTYLAQADLAHETEQQDAEQQALRKALNIYRQILGDENPQTNAVGTRLSQVLN